MSIFKERETEKYDDFIESSTANNDMMDRFGCHSEGIWATDPIDHPSYYGGKDNTYEAINVIEAWDLDFHCGNVIKYIARHKEKNNAKQDIEKAIWYLQRYLKILED